MCYNTVMETIKQAIEFHKNGKFEEAEKLYLRFLETNPKESKAHHLLGLLYFQKGDYKKAIEPLKTALRLETSIAYQTDLALAYFELSDWENAYKYFKKVAFSQKSRIIYEKTVKCAKLLGLTRDVLKHLIDYDSFAPGDEIVTREIAETAFDLGEFEISRKYLLKVIELWPKDHAAYNNLGLITENLSDFSEAERLYRKALEIEFCGNYLYNLAVVLRRMERYDESNACLHELREKKAYDLDKIDFAYSTNLLHNRNFKEGYELFATVSKHEMDYFIKTPWNGEINPNAILALCATEGRGDVIMYSRYLDFINPLAFKEVVVIVPECLLELFKYNFPTLRIVPMAELVLYHYSTILLDLPRIFNIDFNHIPSCEKYLIAQSDYVEKHKKNFSKKTFNVGLFFEGNTENKRTLANRSVPPDLFKPLLEIEHTKFYSLQVEKKHSKTLKKLKITDLSNDIKNFSDTAGVIENLDLVVSIDSAVIHLAGAMGKQALLMLPKSAEWRWFDDTKKTDWYKSVEIFKQGVEGDWNPVIAGVKAKIEELAAAKVKK